MSSFIASTTLHTVAASNLPFLLERTAHFSGILGSEANRAPYWMTLRAAKSGAFSAALRQGAWTARFTGEFGADGSAKWTAPDGLHVFVRFRDRQLEVDIVRDGERVATGIVENFDEDTRSIVRPGTVSFYGEGGSLISEPSETLDFSGSTIGHLVISGSGKVAAVGYTADGAPFSAGASIRRDGSFVLYSPLYRGKGFVTFRMTIDEAQHGSEIFGAIEWFSPGIPGARRFQAGFHLSGSTVGAYYVAPPKETDFATSVFASGPRKFFNSSTALIPAGLNCAASRKSRDFDSDYPGLKLVFDPATGFYRGSYYETDYQVLNGSFIYRGTRREVPVRGILLGHAPAKYRGYGFMLVPNSSEQASIEWDF